MNWFRFRLERDVKCYHTTCSFVQEKKWIIHRNDDRQIFRRNLTDTWENGRGSVWIKRDEWIISDHSGWLSKVQLGLLLLLCIYFYGTPKKKFLEGSKNPSRVKSLIHEILMVGFTFINIDLKAAFCNENQTVDGAITEIKISNLSFVFSKKNKMSFSWCFPKNQSRNVRFRSHTKSRQQIPKSIE